MSRTHKPRIDSWPMLLIGLGFSAIALAALILATWHIASHLRAQTWVTHPAVLVSLGESDAPVTGKRLGSTRTTRLEGRYQYQWQGHDYTGERLSFSILYSNGIDDFEERLADALGEPGDPLRIRVNPANPSESVAFPDIRWAEVGACLCFVFGMGSGGLFFTLGALGGRRLRQLQSPVGAPIRVRGLTVIVMWLLVPLFGLLAGLLWRDGHPVWAAVPALQWLLTLNASIAWLRQRR